MICTSCAKEKPVDLAFEQIKTEAKAAAIYQQTPMAIYEEQGYKYISAAFAYQNGIPVLLVVSQYS